MPCRYLSWLLLLSLGLLPWLTGSYYLRLVELLLIHSIAAIGLQLLTGYTGLISLGQAGFMAMGAYFTAFLLQNAWPLPLALLMAVLLAGSAGMLLGLPANRLSGPYLAIVTLAFGIGITVWIGSTAWLGGSSGLVVPVAPFWQGERILYGLIAALAVLSFGLAQRLVQSPLGLRWQALRDHELAATQLGVNAALNKTLSFVVSAAYGGLAGGLFALYIGYLSPQSFGFTLSVSLLAGIVLGGLGQLGGAVLGVSLLTLLEQNLLPAGLSGLGWMLEGAIMIIIILLVPGGIWPRIQKLC